MATDLDSVPFDQELEDCDRLDLLDDTDCDVVDCAKLIEVVEDNTIPLKYYRLHSSPTSERATEYRLVHDGWGTRLSSLSDSLGLFAIMYITPPMRKSSEAEKFRKALIKVTKTGLDILRWNSRHIFVYMRTAEAYSDLGRSFMAGDLDKCGQFSIDAIEPAVHYNPPRVFVEITGADCDEIYATISPLVLPFSGCFTHLRLRQTTTDTSLQLPPTRPQSACIGLLFDGKHQSLALKSLSMISDHAWEDVELTDEVTKSLDVGVKYFRHKALNLPLISIKTAAPSAGVQITVFVRDRNKYEPMLLFYKSLVQAEPVVRHTHSEDFRYSTLALSRTAELIVTHVPGLSTGPCTNVTLYVKVDGEKSLPGIKRVADGFWEIFDPEGNRVILFEMIK